MPDWDKILGQVAVVTATPIPFLVAVLIAAGLIWWLMNWRYSALMEHKDGEIKLLERQKTEAIAAPADAALKEREPKPQPTTEEKADESKIQSNPSVPADSLKPVYLKNIRVELPSDSTKLELFLEAEVATASDRLQIIFDSTSRRNSYGRDWNDKVSFRIADLKDLFRGQMIRVPLLTYVYPETIAGIPNPNIRGHWLIPPNPIQEQFFWARQKESILSPLGQTASV